MMEGAVTGMGLLSMRFGATSTPEVLVKLEVAVDKKILSEN